MNHNEIVEECAKVADFYAKAADPEVSLQLGPVPHGSSRSLLKMAAAHIRQLKKHTGKESRR